MDPTLRLPLATRLARLVRAEEDHPHELLGPRLEGGPEGGALLVRVLRPDARSVTVLAGERRCQAALALPGGLFEARLEGLTALVRYELDVELADGRRERVFDPYAFGPILGDVDLHLFAEGRHAELASVMGAHVRELSPLGGGAPVLGTSFSVWAPNALRVSLACERTGWKGSTLPMSRRGPGVFELFVPGMVEGALYKFELLTAKGQRVLKSDPYGRHFERRPNTASIVERTSYRFTDEAWMADRARRDARRSPLSIYEVHLGSWRRKVDGPGAGGEPPAATDGSPDGRFLSYAELADELVDHVADLGFTHIELLPVTEHPFDGSWGYQTSGYYAPTSRHGSPDDFRRFVDRCHARGIGVLLDWAPAHFPKDAPFLARFDGSALYEHHDPRKGEHRQWGTHVFHYGRHEVRNFLVGSALHWLQSFHVDGLRVDAVASMLYLDYGSVGPHDWAPNEYGGRENLEAVAFLRELSERVHERHPGAILVAEESTSWPGVTAATYVGGLGFDLKWNMGWMHDTLFYFRLDPVFRSFHHRRLTFGLMYAWSERFCLPLSHDEVVHLKRSLLSKMSGTADQQRAQLRLLYAYMWAHPGKKLLFMGAELGQRTEWCEREGLPWELLDDPKHRGIQSLLRDLNRLLRAEPSLHALDASVDGFRWIDANDAQQSVASFIRFGPRAEPPLEAGEGGDPADPPAGGQPLAPREHLVFVASFTPVARSNYRIGVPRRCAYLEVLNTDAAEYGGDGVGNLGRVEVEDVPAHGFRCSVRLTLPPLGGLFLRPERSDLPDEEPPAEDAEAKTVEPHKAVPSSAEGTEPP